VTTPPQLSDEHCTQHCDEPLQLMALAQEESMQLTWQGLFGLQVMEL